jgi:hypothetical protein
VAVKCISSEGTLHAVKVAGISARGARLCGVLALLLSLTACVRGVHFEIAGDITAPIFRLAPSAFWERGPVCLHRLDVVEMDGDHVRRAVWSVRPAARTCPGLRKLGYGEVPQGFIAEIPASSLAPGLTYEIRVDGSGWLGRCRFAYIMPEKATVYSDFCRAARA